MKLFYTHPAISFVLNQDYFDTSQHEEIHLLPSRNLREGTFVIWDNKMAVLESGVSLEYLKKREDLQVIATFRRNKNGDVTEFVVFGKRN